jgi:hypothetical protein
MKDTDEKAPFATKVLRKGLPILDRKLKELLEEIQEKAKIACKESIGTSRGEIACTINREVQKWEISSQEEMTQKVEDIAYLLKNKVANLHENEYILNKIEAMRKEKDLIKQYEALLFVIGQISTVEVVSEQELDNKLQKLDLIYDKTVLIEDNLNCISSDIFKIKLNPYNMVSTLDAMKKELEKLNEREILNAISLEKLNSTQDDKLNELNRDLLERLDEIKILVYEFSKNNCIPEFYLEVSKKLDELKQPTLDRVLQRASAVISLIGFVIPMMIAIAR